MTRASFLIVFTILMAALAPTAQGAAPQPAFATPQAAAAALCSAVRDGKLSTIRSLLGEGSDAVIDSGDAQADAIGRMRFAQACGARMRVESSAGGRAELIIGLEDWHIPFPLARGAAGWRFDTRAGLDETLARRIGRNELATIQAALAYVDAQREYALSPHDGVAAGAYARRIASAPGRHDGLYWIPARDDALSPLGVLFAKADADEPGTPQPYHGYLFRVLTAQGAHATGGAQDYIVKARMIGGFALIAWPSRYRIDGVRTFAVSQDGVVYSRDLGARTDALARAVKAFDPDTEWRGENLAAAAPRPDEHDARQLATERGCMLCHAEIGAPVIQTPPAAPSFRDIAARYRNRADAEEVLTRTVINGSSPDERHWARSAAFASMLPNEQEATPDEARTLVRWILSLAR
jgi:cytochrome c551/c552